MMNESSLGEHLRLLAMLGHADLVAPTPARCQALWEQGKARGFPLGQLFVLRRPLTPGVGGAYDRASGDVWVLDDPERPEQTARHLLHELAHAQQPSPAPTTIEADWDEEAATEARARALAVAWGVPDLFTEDDLQAALVEIEELRARLMAAGELAGTLEPALARRAYAACWRLGGEAGWAKETFADALFGIADDPAANVGALEFDRCALRARWRLGWNQGIDFGRLTLAPDETGASLLRSSLVSVARKQARPRSDPFVTRAAGATYRHQFAFFRLEGQYDLTPIIATANEALLAHAEEYALATWECYGDAADAHTQRLYRLWVQYGRAGPDCPAPDRHLWVLALPRRPADLCAEAAFQQYVRGWRAHTALHVDDWWLGLYELAEQLRTAD